MSEYEIRNARLATTCKARTDGTLDFTMSTRSPDRDGDIIEQVWETDEFFPNGVFLCSHDSRLSTENVPLGRINSVTSNKQSSAINVTFVPASIWPFAETVKQLYEHKFLNAVSAGFRPLEVKEYSDPQERQAMGLGAWGIHVLRSKLIEVSACIIPANAEALIQRAKSGEGHKIAPIYGPRGTTNNAKDYDAKGVEHWFAQTTPNGATAAAVQASAERLKVLLASL